MENVGHTLAGLALARAGLGRTTPLATTALVVGANLPDVDLAWSSFHSALAYLHYHRGWTHSLLGFAVLTPVLWLVLLGVDRRLLARRSTATPRARPLPLLAAAAIGVGAHLLMDLANSYGVRWLLPWSDRWSYGDLWVIVDPWLWLFLGGAVYATGEGGRRRDWIWAMAAAAAAIVVMSAPLVRLACRIAWMAGLLATVALCRLRRRLALHQNRPRIALAGTIGALGYAGLCLLAHDAALARLAAMTPESPGRILAVLPRPADPLRWEAFVVDRDTIRHRVIGAAPAFDPPVASWTDFPQRFDEPAVRSYLETCAGRVVLEFSRFPYASIEDDRDGGRSVIVRDARYARGGRGFAVFTARLGPDGAPQTDPGECP